MKARWLFSMILSVLTLSVLAQSVENDDMYFNSKDRAKLKAAKGKEEVYASARKQKDIAPEEDEQINPTDSYSARNVNPEYAARSNAEIAKTDDENYFSTDYRYNTMSDLNSWNNNFNSQYNNSWYQNSYWAPGMYGWNSPYYGNYYDPWSNIWASPYSRPGWRSSISFSYGSGWYNGWGSGWSMGFGNSYGYGYGNPYGFGNPYWYDPYSYWYNPYSYWGGGYGYPRTVVIVNNGESGGRKVTYGKRPSRGSSIVRNNTEVTNRPRQERTLYSNESNGRSTRTSTAPSNGTRTGNRQPEYYDRTWKYTSNGTSNSGNNNSSEGRTGSERSNSSSRGSSYNSYNNNSNNSYNNNSSRSSSYNSGSSGRSSSSGSSGGSRSSSSSGSGSNGRSRGGR